MDINKINTNSVIPDIQSLIDARQIPIKRVGIRDVCVPTNISDASSVIQNTIANWTMTVSLSENDKGTHMSRFLVLLENYRTRILTPSLLGNMSLEMLTLLNAINGDISLSFPFFIEKTAPISKSKSLMDYKVEWIVRATEKINTEFELIIQIPVTSLCPCSKAISSYGAHNQRSNITISLVFNDYSDIKMSDFIVLAEKESSCELWSLLKRPDEKYVTEYAYENPKFVEDLVRDLAASINSKFLNIKKYRIEAENFESIHNHSAYAVVEKSV
ncbi:MAG: GTP cyclohydrolase I FolE2 [Candidatus Kinetoplastibacterium crithidii]|nr:GTP cyclohydrolase I FolE2 [Candidatus Kinetoplastibacterium crithidii]